MNHPAARAIGDDIGGFMETEADGGELAAGRVLRLKVHLDIWKPLRHEITEEEKGVALSPMNICLTYVTCVGSLDMWIARVQRSWG